MWRILHVAHRVAEEGLQRELRDGERYEETVDGAESVLSTTRNPPPLKASAGLLVGSS